jgi:signal transduction histidine kinase
MAAEHIYESSRRLLVVLNDLLDFSKLEAGKMGLDEIRFDPKRIIRDVIGSIAPTAAKKHIVISTSIDPTLPTSLFGDEGKIRQTLLNFAHNAVKFTDEGEMEISINLERTTNDTLFVRFAVHDTGIGIREEVKQSLFQPFVQADGSTRRRFGGTGLGLSIAKRLVDLMNGEIGLESKLGVGSTFWFGVPLKQCAETESHEHTGLC